MASKQVTDRQKAATAVVAVVDTSVDRLRAGIAAVIPDAAAAKKTADAVQALAEAVGALLRSRADAMVAADEAHAVELADDTGLRSGRDALVTQLRDRLVALREGLASLYGASVPQAAGFSGNTPDDPVVLVRFAREVVQGLAKVKLPPPKFPMAVIVLADESKPIAELATELDVAIKAITEDVKENQLTKTARDAAMTAHDATFSQSAALLTALFAFAAEPGLAERVRPSGRRPGRLAAADITADSEDTDEAGETTDPGETGGSSSPTDPTG